MIIIREAVWEVSGSRQQMLPEKRCLAEACGEVAENGRKRGYNMEKREMTCITCPLGCSLTAVREDNGEITVTGNTCPRGEKYAKNEILDPRRTVTTTVRVKRGAGECLVPVKTAGEIPKDKIRDCIRAVGEAKVTAPIAIGDVIVKNVADTGVDVVATKSLDA